MYTVTLFLSAVHINFDCYGFIMINEFFIIVSMKHQIMLKNSTFFKD